MRYPIAKDPKITSLISTVRTNPVLYDHRLLGHSDEKLKAEVWKSVAATCGMSSVEAAMCWKDLYTCFITFYRNELIRLVRANYTESEVGPIPAEFAPQNEEHFINRTWGYYSDMGFIAPFRIKGADPELDRLIELAMPLVCREANRVTSVTDPISTTSSSASKTLIMQSNLSGPLLGMDVPPIEMADLTTDDDICLRSFFDSLYRSTRMLPKHLQRQVKTQMLHSLNLAETEDENTTIE